MIRLFVLTCLTLLCSDVAALQFTILPDSTSELADEIVDMNCSLGTQKVNFLYSIKIIKEGQSLPLATILTGDKTIVHDASNSVAVNGHVDRVAPDTSYLHLRWSHPTFQNNGVYTCEITYLDLTENTKTSKLVSKLTVKRTIDMHDIVRAILHIRDQTAERDQEIETLRQENKNLQKSLTERDSQLLKDMRETLNNAQRKSVGRESITDATRKVLLENTNKLNTLFDNFNNLTKMVNKLIDVNNKCPNGWKRFRNQCFKYFEERITWPQARDNCQSPDVHLAVIPDAPTNAFIHDMIRNVKHEVWIGLNDRTSEGKYVWNGSPQSVSYFNWRSDQPDTHDGWDYAVISPKDGKWIMLNTEFIIATFICQKTLVLI